MAKPLAGRCIVFGPFVLYPEVRQLYRHGIRLRRCHPQQAAFLAILAEHPGSMVTKKELELRLWPLQMPHKNRLNVLASSLWTLLDDTNPEKRKYFASAGREGYCFICPVEQVEHPENRNTDLATEAYRAGKHCLEDLKASSLREAVSWFKRAIDLNPSYALAWVGLADAHIVMGMHCVESPEVTFAKARAASQEAMQILPALPEAITSAAWIALCYDWDYRKAEDGFLYALRTIPAYPRAHRGLALLRLATGRLEDGWPPSRPQPSLVHFPRP